MLMAYNNRVMDVVLSFPYGLSLLMIEKSLLA
jgi:hypothetical protein